MKRVFIIHGWSFGPSDAWYVWTKSELEKKGYEVYLPKMPLSIAPVISLWVSYLRRIVGVPDENTYFIGHSIGCQAIMRYLAQLPKETRVGGAVFVAGWFYLDNVTDLASKIVARPWLRKSIDTARVRNVCEKTAVLLSSNEPYGFVAENKKRFEGELGASVTVSENRGHFSDLKILPEALEAILKLATVN